MTFLFACVIIISRCFLLPRASHLLIFPCINELVCYYSQAESVLALYARYLLEYPLFLYTCTSLKMNTEPNLKMNAITCMQIRIH